MQLEHKMRHVSMANAISAIKYKQIAAAETAALFLCSLS